MFRRTALALAFVPATLVTPAAHAAGHSIDANCTYAGMLNQTATMDVVYGGTAVATGPAGSVAMATSVTCSIRNGSQSDSASVVLPGSASAVADIATGWDPTRPITICVSAFAVFGPTPVVTVTLPERCVTPTD